MAIIDGLIFFGEKFPIAVDNLTSSLKTSLPTVIWPCRLIFFTVHNYLTGRDYSYSMDDLFDIIMLTVVTVWFSTYMIWT